MFRQGDVLVVPVEKMPADLEKVPRDNGRLILAYGEVTGHAHVVEGGIAELFTQGDLDELEERFLHVEQESALVHDEHSTIVLPPGDYAVRRQREYAPEAPRQVAD
jgi:hypothetical protein